MFSTETEPNDVKQVIVSSNFFIVWIVRAIMDDFIEHPGFIMHIFADF